MRPTGLTAVLAAAACLAGCGGAAYGISAGGRVLTIYPANFRPSDIVHDLPKLAAM